VYATRPDRAAREPRDVNQAGARAAGRLEENQTMNVKWSQLLTNLAGVGVLCAGAQQLPGMGHASWSAWGAAIGLCALTNVIGLAQQKVIGGPDTPAK
jgi:hypothetical protein